MMIVRTLNLNRHSIHLCKPHYQTCRSEKEVVSPTSTKRKLITDSVGANLNLSKIFKCHKLTSCQAVNYWNDGRKDTKTKEVDAYSHNRILRYCKLVPQLTRFLSGSDSSATTSQDHNHVVNRGIIKRCHIHSFSKLSKGQHHGRGFFPSKDHSYQPDCLQSVRFFSTSNRKERYDDEEQKSRLRGAVMYFPNPVNWVMNKWNAARLQRTFDPSFSEDEFVYGASQAISTVSQMVSKGEMEKLSGLVTDEVKDYLRSFSKSLSSQELKAFALEADDMVLLKIRNLLVDEEEDEKSVSVDALCFGLKVCDKVPYLVHMGPRFQRDYSTDPPGSWVITEVKDLQLEKLGQD